MSGFDTDLIHKEMGVAPRTEPGWNFGSTVLGHGTLVVRDHSQTDTTALKAAVKRTIAVAQITRTLLGQGAIGLLQAADKKVVGADRPCLFHRGGFFNGAKVYVPQSVDLPAGTHLVPATEWDATNNVVKFGRTIGSTFWPGLLEPVLWPTGAVADSGSETLRIADAANPFAILLEPLTASASAATRQSALVDMVHQGPKPVEFPFLIATIAAGDFPVARPLGPGYVAGWWCHPGDQGTTNDTTMNVYVAPGVATTTDRLAALSAGMVVGNAGTAAAVIHGTQMGPTGVLQDAAAFGANSTHGTWKARDLRIWPRNSVLEINVASSPASSAVNFRGTVQGIYL